MPEFLSLKTEAFGLDISDLSLKIIKLKRSGDFFSLASFGEASIRKGIIEDGEIKNQEALVKIIKAAVLKVKGEKLKTNYAIASLPEEKAFLQVIKMPKMKEDELKDAVHFEAENYIPLPIEEVYLDSQILAPAHGHTEHLDVLITALPKKIINPYVFCLKKAGLKPKALEIESQGISRALVKNEESSIPLLIIDIGASRTSFIIFYGHSLRFTSSIPISSKIFTLAVSRFLEIDLIKAEKLKIKCGLNNKTSEEKEIFGALIPSLTDLIEQIERHISYYQSHTYCKPLSPSCGEVEKILLCGGGATLKGLPEFLAAQLKLPVAVGNPWVNILPKFLKEVPIIPFEKSLGYTTALGLALRGIKFYD